jgi:hypothetical protein
LGLFVAHLVIIFGGIFCDGREGYPVRIVCEIEQDDGQEKPPTFGVNLENDVLPSEF